uniref:Uncharacterized protein n=1 Tax=Zea mays TaxID=4577 RepID=A0A804Q356_MAIZE
MVCEDFHRHHFQNVRSNEDLLLRFLLLYEAFDLPSDDSDDNDFDPNMPEEHVASKEEESSEEEEDDDGGSDSDDSDFLTCSDDLEPLIDKKKVDDLGLPSEDSEDDDYDPAGPDSDKDVEKKSNSDESDFTSDSDDFCKEIKKSGGHDEVSSPPLPDVKVGDMEKNTAQSNTISSADDPMETEIDQSVVLPVSRRRQAERLDYKRLRHMVKHHLILVMKKNGLGRTHQ